MDQYLWLKSLHFHGPPLINSIVNDSTAEPQNKSKKQRMYNFIKNYHGILFQEKPAAFQKPISFDPLPTELFWDCSMEQRRKLFFKYLERGDILLCKVINVSLPDNYKLLVLAKHKCCMKLDDLSLVMYLPKLKQEIDVVEGELKNYDVIRAAVCSCSLHERRVFVTLDNTILDEEAEPVKLGKITTDELPSYVGDVQVPHSSYKAYYHQTPEFGDPNWASQLYDVLGLKKNYIYSLHKEWDGKQCPEAETAKTLKLKHTIWLSDMHYNKAVQYYNVQNFAQAILCLNQALAIYPHNKKALVSRGTLYFKTNDLNKAFIDTDQAMQLDPLYEPASKQMSVLLVDVAKQHKALNKLKLAKEALKMAIGLNDLNDIAKQLLLKIEEEEEEEKMKGKISTIPTIIGGTPTKYKKKKRKHRRSYDEYKRRDSFHKRSKSRSPKRKKSMQSVVNKVKNN